jgi:hypothetical protein
MNVGSLTTVVPALIGLILVRSLNLRLRLLLIYLVITAIKEVVCVYLGSYGKTNLHIYNIAVAFNKIPLFLVYYYTLSNKTFKKITLLFIAISSVFAIYNVSFGQGLYSFNTRSMLVTNFFIIIITLLYFYEILKKAEILSLTRVPMFWVSSSFLFYSAGTFLVFSLYEIYRQFSQPISIKIWIINSILYIVLNILLSIALLCVKKKTY